MRIIRDHGEATSSLTRGDGMDLTSFVLGPAIERARQVLSDHAIIALSKSGQATLAGLLAKPPKPTEALTQLMSLPDFSARKA